MDLQLIPHAMTHPRAVKYVSVQVRRQTEGLNLFYVVEGDPSRIAIPAAVGADRADGLWRTTCFELFIGEASESYSEFNFSPSSQWAAYGFDGYRGRPMLLELAEPPRIGCSREPEGLFLWSTIDVAIAANTRLGLSAVIEEVDGTKSYWSLAHPDPDKPDFHHPDSFVFEVPPAA